MRNYFTKTRGGRRLLKRIGVVLLAIVIGLLIGMLMKNAKAENIKREKEMVNTYVTCLNENWTQRDYCAREQGTSYHYMDQLIKKYGYKYIQKGYDLYIVEDK